MTIDITKCIKINIVDSCAVSNILSSLLLFARLDSSGFFFSVTKYVEYECLYKSRAKADVADKELQRRLLRHQKNGKFSSHILSIADLQDASIQKYSQQLGTGELSSIAFAKKINQSFLTDDLRARRIAKAILGESSVQTTPHLVGWLFYEGILFDGDLDSLIFEHNNFNRPLEKYFRLVYSEAFRIRSIFKST
ncbi:MAG: hypothetical protein ACJ75B_00295 [Flavisolibacter sp.]